MYDDEIDASSRASLRQAFTSQLGGGALDESQARFVEQAADDVVPDELPGASPEELAAVLARFWRFAVSGDLRTRRVQLSSAQGSGGGDLGLDILAIAQPDAPFLVDSVMGALSAGGYDVRAMFHPVVRVGVQTEAAAAEQSLILVLLAPVGEDRRVALLEEVERTLDDVHAAVTDARSLRDLAARAAEELAASSAPFGAYGMQEYVDFLHWLTAGRFVFLGARTYDYPRTPQGGYAAEEPVFAPEGSLGLLRDQSLAVVAT